MSTGSAKLQEFMAQLEAWRNAGGRGGPHGHAAPHAVTRPAQALEGQWQLENGAGGSIGQGATQQGWELPAQHPPLQLAAPQQASWAEQPPSPQALQQQQQQTQEQQHEHQQPQQAAAAPLASWGGEADVIDLTDGDPAAPTAQPQQLPSPWQDQHHQQHQYHQQQWHWGQYPQAQACMDYPMDQPPTQQQELQYQMEERPPPYAGNATRGAQILEEERRLLVACQAPQGQHGLQGQQAEQAAPGGGQAGFDSGSLDGGGASQGFDAEQAVLLARQALERQGHGRQDAVAMLQQAMRQAQQAQHDGRQHPMLQSPVAARAPQGSENSGAGSGRLFLAQPSQQPQAQRRILPGSLTQSSLGLARGYRQPHTTQLILPASTQQTQQAQQRTITTGGGSASAGSGGSGGGQEGQARFVTGVPSYLKPPPEGLAREEPSAAMLVAQHIESQLQQQTQQVEQRWPRVLSNGSLVIQAGPRRLPATLTSSSAVALPHHDLSYSLGRYMGTGAATAAAAAAAVAQGYPLATTPPHHALPGLGRTLQPHLVGGAAGAGLLSYSGAGAGPGLSAGGGSGGGGGIRPGGLSYEIRPAMSAADNRAALKACMDGLEAAETKEEREPPEGVLLVPLMRHQKLALAWMAKRELGRKGPVGGILADDQGLGKTVSTIALIVTNRPDATQQGSKRSAEQGAAGPAGAQRGGGASKRARSGSRGSLASYAAAAGAAAAGTAAAGGHALAVGPDVSANSASAGGVAAGGSTAMVEELEGPGGNSGYDKGGAELQHGEAVGTDSDSSDGSSGSGSSEEEVEEVIELDCSGDDEAAMESKPTNFLPQGGTLVVCPTTVLHQWANEIKSKTNPNAGISVHIYHGKGKLPSPEALARYAVVLTTYATLAMEAPSKGAPVRKKKAAAQAERPAATAAGAATGLEGPPERDGLIDLCIESGGEEEAPSKQQQQAAAGTKAKPKRANDGRGEKGGPLYLVYWHRVVLDEAQCIKNRSTLAAHAAWSLRACRRWCLSGTPMQNSVDDLYSYFRFLRHAPWNDPTKFKELIKDQISQNPEKGFRRLQGALMGVVLRRTKQSKIDGEPVVKLPERRQAQRPCDFSAGEAEFYQRLAVEASEKMKRFQAEGTVRQNYVSILWMLLRLRQACNHPWLVKGAGQQFQHQHHQAKVATAEVHAVQKLAPALRQTLSNTLKEHLTECAVCGDVPEDPVVSVCNHIYCSQCVSSLVSIAGHGAAEAELAFHCPACGHTLGKHDTFSAEAFATAAAAAVAVATTQPGVQGLEAPGASAGDKGAGGAGSQADGGWQSSAKIDALMELLRGLRDSRLGVGEGCVGEARRSVLTTARSLSHAKLAAALKRRSPPAPAPGGGSDGSKRPSAPMEKVIVFSQWTGMLDLVEVPLKRESFSFRRLDGSMSVAARQAAISDFSKRPEVGVMLVSLKAASLGVNLVSANHVVLLDPWWNPTVEEQAIDRAHRIGQTKPVHVTRIVIKGSVEDKIMELQDKKRRMVAAAFGEEGGSGGLAANKLSEAELVDLFQV